MKNLTAVKFRIILIILLVATIALIVGAFAFGYKYLQGVGQETAKRQADATASEDSVSNLQRLQAELDTKAEAVKSISDLRSTSSLPQFDTERSLRTIAGQLDIPVKNIVFVNESSDGQAADGTAPAQDGSSSSPAQNTRPGGNWGSRNSRISFEFGRKVSYNELIQFYHAIETSTPKLRLSKFDIPSEATRNSINPGVLVLELATT